MVDSRTVELIRKLRAKGNSTKGFERSAFRRKAADLEFKHLGRWTWFRLMAVATKSKEGMVR